MADVELQVTESTALVVIPKAELIFVPGGAAPLLSTIKQRARDEAAKLDASTPKGREALTSLGFKLRRMKVAMDDAGKELKDAYQTKITPIDAERRTIRDEMTDLADEIEAPVKQFKAMEVARVAAHESAIAEIETWSIVPPEWTSAQIDARLTELAAHPHRTRDWQEFKERAQRAATASFNALKVARHDAAEREDAATKAAETARLAAAAEVERVEQERIAREARIAEEAAETARKAAEAEAARKAKEAERIAQRADYHRRMLQHVKNCGFGFIDSQPQPIGILQHELTTKIAFDEENFGDLLPQAIVARDEALAALQRSIDKANQRLAQEEAAERERLAGAERERLAAAALARSQEQAREAERQAQQLAQQREADRIAAHEAALEDIRLIGIPPPGMSSVELTEFIRRLSVLHQSRKWEEFVERAGDERITANRSLLIARTEAQGHEAAQAEAARVAAEKREQEAVAAALAARQRIEEAARLNEAEETRKREANKAHRAKINREALAPLILLGLTEDQGRGVIGAIARGEVPHVNISY